MPKPGQDLRMGARVKMKIRSKYTAGLTKLDTSIAKQKGTGKYTYIIVQILRNWQK